MSQQINLFNPIFLKQKKIFGAKPMLQALGLVVAGVILVSAYAQRHLAVLEQQAESGKSAVSGRESRLNKVNVQFAPRTHSAALAAELTQAQQELKSLHDVEAVLQGGALGNTRGYAEYFRAFARQNVSGLWLTGLTIVGAGNNIGVQGRAMQPTMIPNYISRLTAEKVMQGKTFASLRIERPQQQTQEEAEAPGAAPLAPAAAPTQAGTAAAGASAAAAPAVLSPFVEFNLQSQAAEGGK